MRREARWAIVGGVCTALSFELMHEADLPPHVEARGYEEPSTPTYAANHTATVNVSANFSNFALSEIPVKPILTEGSLRAFRIQPQFSSVSETTADDIKRHFATDLGDSPEAI